MIVNFFIVTFSLLVYLFSAVAYAAEGEWTGEKGIEYRYFKDPGENGQAQNDLAFRISAEYYNSWNDGNDYFTFLPYLLLDQKDEERTHADIRELLWIHVGKRWELRTGITRVFWGKTEFLNVVDVINQMDLVDDDSEKLGQPMLNLSLVHEWGIFDYYLLLGFRERTFPGEDGRLRTYFPVNADNPEYTGGAGPNNIDFAFRWQRPLSDSVEGALSLFSGVDREPWFSVDVDLTDLDSAQLVPTYHQKDQIGLELEYIQDSLALKFEGAFANDPVENYYQVVAGFEYSFYGLLGSNVDLTLITEGMYDSRDASALGFLEHDVGFGGRFAFNDQYDTSIMTGMLWDPDTEEKVLGFEASRRLNANFKLEFQARTVLERGRTDLPENSFQAINRLIDQRQLDISALDFDYRTLLRLLPNILKIEGNLITINDQYGKDVLNEFVKLVDEDRKLSIIESEDYFSLRLTYYY